MTAKDWIVGYLLVVLGILVNWGCLRARQKQKDLRAAADRGRFDEAAERSLAGGRDAAA